MEIPIHVTEGIPRSPATLSVNHKSRHQTLKHYYKVQVPRTPSDPLGRPIFLDPTVDAVHLSSRSLTQRSTYNWLRHLSRETPDLFQAIKAFNIYESRFHLRELVRHFQSGKRRILPLFTGLEELSILKVGNDEGLAANCSGDLGYSYIINSVVAEVKACFEQDSKRSVPRVVVRPVIFKK